MGVNQSAAGSAAWPANLFSLAELREWRQRRGPHAGAAVTGRYHVNVPLSSKYEVSDESLGTGMSGPVMKARGKHGREFAVKTLRKTSDQAIASMKKEVLIMLSLDHPNIARIEDVFESDTEIFLVMEKLEGGELLARIEKGRYAENVAADACRAMCSAVAYLHSERIVHRDLKPENFLYQSAASDHLKLIDFGLSAMWDKSVGPVLREWCGSTGYQAPEILQHLPYTEKCDCFSLGVIAYGLLAGHPPFVSSLRMQEYTPFVQPSFKGTSVEAQAFVRSLLEPNPERRLSASDALQHDWLREGRQMQGPELEAKVDRLAPLQSMQRWSTASRFKRMCLGMVAWSLTESDREQLRECFTAMDANGNGRISLNEMRSALRDNFAINSREAEELFGSLVGGDEEEVAYSDFLAAAMQQRVRMHEAALWDTFSRFDRANKGEITAKDLRLMLDEGFEAADAAALLGEVDRRGRGVVTRQAFVEYLTASEGEAAPTNLQARHLLAARLIDRQREHERTKPESGFGRRLNTFAAPPSNQGEGAAEPLPRAGIQSFA